MSFYGIFSVYQKQNEKKKNENAKCFRMIWPQNIVILQEYIDEKARSVFLIVVYLYWFLNGEHSQPRKMSLFQMRRNVTHKTKKPK